MRDFGKYNAYNTIGTGGMAKIYLAEDKTNGKKVAIKEILPQIASDREFLKRFVREIKIMQSLSHPNILPIFDACLGPDEYYIVMPYLSGGTLKELLTKVQKIPIDFSIYILQQIMKALEYAHHKGVIHRDLKPSNVMFGGDGNLYLTDFGVARASTLTQLTQTGEILGTPGYMSPEQILGMELTYKSDYFSFGIMCYELMTGINPFLTDNPITTMKQIVEFYPPGPMDINPSIPPLIEDIILKLLKKNVDERISNGMEIIECFLSYWNGKEIGNLKDDFIEFLKNPEEVVKKYQEKEALEHKKIALELLSKNENKTMVYWHIFQAYSLNPEDYEANRIFENLKSSLGETKKATDPIIEKLEERWRQNPENINVLIQLGKIYRNRKDYLNLLKIYNRLNRFNIKDPYLRGQVQSLIIQEEPKKEKALQEIRKESFSIFKAIPFWFYLIIGILLMILFVGKMITKGQKEAAEAMAPISQEVEKIFDTLDKTAKEIDIDIKPIIKMEKEGKLKEAYESYNALIQDKPGHKNVHILHERAGLVAFKIGNFSNSTYHLKIAYDKSSFEKKKDFLLALAESYIKNGQNYEAEKIFEDGINFEDEEISPKCLLKRAELYIRQSKINSAKEDLNNLINNYPDSLEFEKAKNLKATYGIE